MNPGVKVLRSLFELWTFLFPTKILITRYYILLENERNIHLLCQRLTDKKDEQLKIYTAYFKFEHNTKSLL